MIRAPFLFRPALHYVPMKITRRVFSFFLFLAPLVFSVAGGSADQPAANRKYLVFVGTYTTKTESRGIYGYEFDADTGKLTPKGVAAEARDPSWVAVHPSGKFLYAANEAGKASTVSAFAVDVKSGKLTLLNQKLGEHTALVQVSGATGPNKERQEGSHAHWIETSMGNGTVFVAALGLDRVMTYKFDPAKGTLGAMPAAGPHQPFVQNALELSPGTGPRHAAISKVTDFRRFLYVLGELDSTITVFGTTKEGIFGGAIQKVPMLPAEFSGRNDAAEIEIHPSGKFLYASNRGHDIIAIFAIDPAKGTLTFVTRVPTGGKEPRHFAIDPSGKYLLAENQFSNNIVVFKIDPGTGGLTATGQVAEVPSPVDIAFLQQD